MAESTRALMRKSKGLEIKLTYLLTHLLIDSVTYLLCSR